MHKHNTNITGLALYLVRDHLLSPSNATHAVQTAQEHGYTLTHYLVKSKQLTSQDILRCGEKYYRLPIFDLTHFEPNTLLKPELIHRHRVIPLFRDEYNLHIGIADPSDQTISAALNFHTGLRVHLFLVAEDALEKVIQLYYPLVLNTQLENALAKLTPQEDIAPPIPQDDDEPISEFVDHLLQDALNKNASDIHIEPYDQFCRIRFRRDGLLFAATTIPHHLATRVLTRLKMMANLNIAERRLPQDGRIQLKRDAKIDLRVNVCPTLFGEKMVLRILDSTKLILAIDALGMNAQQIHLFQTALSQPQGLILITGPTGSGKTVTLYSALQHLNRVETNISSVEDPVEIEMMGINQVNVNPRIGLEFHTVLRTFLRQDPDVIMVGEIRDAQTAAIAIQAAQTGHLVLSTLHTNNALETLTRLESLGINPAQLHYALIISQRLVRLLCPYHCQTGCEHCHQGYKNRTGVFDLLQLPRDATAECGLWKSGLEKVQNKLTSYQELQRTLPPLAQ